MDVTEMVAGYEGRMDQTGWAILESQRWMDDLEKREEKDMDGKEMKI